MAVNELSPKLVQSPAERVDSEYECDLMIEALGKELTQIRDHLAFLTHYLDTETQKEPSPQATPTASPVVSPEPKGPAKKKVESNAPVPVSAVRNRAVGRSQTHYLGVVDRLEEERALAQKQCLQLMKDHVENQLVTLQKRSEALRRRLAKRQSRIRAAKLKLKPPRFRSSGVDDTSFLGNVYISTFYQIVGEEHRLKQEGKIKTLTDLKEFWDSMLSPLVHAPTPPQDQSPDVVVVDEDEDYTNSWALTALTPDRRSKTPLTLTEDNSQLEFVPSIPPKLLSVTDLLGEGRKLREEVRGRRYSLPEAVRERRQVQRMYQQARANEMVMRRLLPPSPTFDLSPLSIKPREQATVCDVTAMAVPPPILLTPPPLPAAPPTLPTPPTLSTHDDQSTPPSQLTVPPMQLTKVTPSQVPPRRQTKAPSLILPPLTMDTALQEGKIIEPKCRSTLWTNFTAVTVAR